MNSKFTIRTYNAKFPIQNSHSKFQIPNSKLQQSFHQPAVHLHRRPSDVRRGVGQEKRGRAAELVGPTVAAERNGGGGTALLLFE